MTLVIRPFRGDDAPAVFAFRQAVMPYLVDTVAAMCDRAARVPETSRETVLVAELDGVVVGRARAGLEWETTLAGQGEMDVLVAPGHRGRGAGSALLQAAEKHLAAVGAVVLRGNVLDTDSAGFAERRGYQRRTSAKFQELDLSALPPIPPAPGNAALSPFARFGADPRPLHAVEAEAIKDEPADIPFDASPYEDWRRMMWRHPLMNTDLSTAVVVDERPVCTVSLFTDGIDRVYSAMTGTLRGYRGRGLVKYAKTAALHRAREHGYRFAYTANADDNVPMLAINRWLGYRPCAEESLYAKPAAGHSAR
ncbi:GNAT family N-acetyltransferase [Nocardiopsis ansamitocini]|uniref:N-acetyltransferase n=1 Tax=Nocardiopsis ansamitocini TaxID=1670832 RepID=A0A9W6P893_9ACTN|nr:GNAT family N-acetyltransferase [Nocardiopsis ansamitocini]GLU49375.1 N-acetyltransferase [Nocardiopsis ansamitocini]